MFNRPDTATNKQRIFNKFTKNLHLDRLTRTPSPTADSALISNAEDFLITKKTATAQRKMKLATDPNAKLIPLRNTRSSPGNLPTLSQISKVSTDDNGGKEMMNNAFEVAFDKSSDISPTQNVHPLDEPLTLRNGKKIYPSSPTLDLNATSNQLNDSGISFNDLMSILNTLFTFSYSVLKKFWNMDLNFDISISESSTMKLHIPTVIFSLILLKILHSILSPRPEHTYNVLAQPKEHSGVGLLPILIFCSIAAYWYYNTKKLDTVLSSKPSTPASCRTSFLSNDTHSLDESVNSSDTGRNIWDHGPTDDFTSDNDATPPLTRMNSLTTKLETMIHKNKPHIIKSNHPISHRLDERRKAAKLNLNIAISPPEERKRRGSPLHSKPSAEFEELTRIRRDEMLKAFNK